MDTVENTTMQVNITTKVNSKAIRKEMYNGREHWVVSSYTLPFGVVMNGGLYNRDQIEANYKSLEGTLAPLGHPTVNGKFVSAFSPEGLNQGYVGAWNRNARIDGSRVAVEKWIDVAKASESEGGRALLERIEAVVNGEGEPIHTSVAVYLEQLPAPPGADYEWIANIRSIDHDAILIDQPGAATPEQGVGLMVNADQAVPLKANAGALQGESYRQREERLNSAAKARWVTGPDDYVWIADFTDAQAVVVRNGGVSELYGYTIDGQKVTFDVAGTPVVRQESWITTVTNSLKRIFNHQARPDMQPQEGDMPLTAEEKAGLVTDIGATVAANVAEQLKPIVEKVTALEANHKELSDSLTANQKAEEADKRKVVAEKLGEVVANALTGDALDEAYKQCGTASPIGNSAAATKEEFAVPDPATHFKQGA